MIAVVSLLMTMRIQLRPFSRCADWLGSIPTGILATTVFGMSLRDSSLVIIFFSIITCIPPAFMGVGGMFTGQRQLIQARYSFG
jgi:purine-cytosine permease-like protein